MADLNGSYEIVAKTPVGDQKMTVTLETSGDAFTGKSDGTMGAAIISGSVVGNTLKWTQDVKAPMPLLISVEVAVDGEAVTGKINTSVGVFPVSGRKVA